jgi:hypothetical protein
VNTGRDLIEEAVMVVRQHNKSERVCDRERYICGVEFKG